MSPRASLTSLVRLAAALALGAGGAALASGAGQSARPRTPEPAIVAGVDHVPIAVGDLDAAAARYRALGFALKPGTPHANGIRNQHVKFRDGTELELITAPEARDSLTAYYRSHLASGDGPAFLALYAPDRTRLMARLDERTVPYRRSGALVTMPDGPLRYLFFGPRNQAPTDREEHFSHANTAESFVGVWIAGDDLSAERALLGQLDVTFDARRFRFRMPRQSTSLTSVPAVSSCCPARTRSWRDGRSQGRPCASATWTRRAGCSLAPDCDRRS